MPASFVRGWFIILVVTTGSLLIVRSRVRRQAALSLSADLVRSLATFQNLQLQRREALIHENALLADLPSLKVLMTTGDQRTIADGATEFWQVSGSDLFALADKNGRVLTTNTRGALASPQVQASLQGLPGLAAVYANAEFLSSPLLSDAERLELLADIQVAVYGTTELIDSLLIFSKDSALQRARKSVLLITQGALGLLRAHPEAEDVSIHVNFERPHDTDAFVDAKKIERALYNLLLNACQSARKNPVSRNVEVNAASTPDMITIHITDSGTGVSDSIRDSLFEPFVSEGKQSGTGLGLTLAYAIAKEHGGAVTLLSTRPGQATFQLTLCRNLPIQAPAALAQPTQAPAAFEQRSARDLEDAKKGTNV